MHSETHAPRDPPVASGKQLRFASRIDGLTFAFYVTLCLSLVLYVYRVAVAGVNLSLYRAVLLGWLAYLGVDVLRGRVRPERRFGPFLAVASAMVVINVIDFASLQGFPDLRRDIIHHLLNVTFAGLVLVYVDTPERRFALLRAFMVSSLLTTAITLYSAFYDRLPVESLIRSMGSTLTKSQTYISDDLSFERATAAFFDPNFYGIYSLLVLLVVMYLWLADRPARHLGAFFALNLVCLSLTLSRTAVVGTLAALGLSFLLARRSRVFSVVSAVAVVALLYAATSVQSHTVRQSLRRDIERITSSTPDGQTPSKDAREGRDAGDSHGTSVVGSVGAVAEVTSVRVADGKSIEGRLNHIRQGWRVFQSSPVWGHGSAALLGKHTRWASAHVSVLTLLARYGVLGTAVYMVFLLWPLWMIWRRGAPASDRYFVTLVTGTLMVVYLGYDILLFFELQYLFFGVTWGMATDAWRSTPPTAVAA